MKKVFATEKYCYKCPYCHKLCVIDENLTHIGMILVCEHCSGTCELEDIL